MNREKCEDCGQDYCECAWIDRDAEEGVGPEVFMELDS